MIKKFIDKLAVGGFPVGTVVTLADPMETEILSVSGYDFIWIDMEHSALDKREVNGHILAARSRGVPPFVRIASNDPILVKPILEMGPAAVIFPQINTAQEAAEAVAACRYPPSGVRGFGPSRADDFGRMNLAEYLKTAETEPWVVIQIESIRAVKNLERICAVPGIGSLLIGPFDLSASVGKTGQIDDLEVVALYQEIARVSKAAGVPFGAFSPTSESAIGEWVGRGASWLTLDTDVRLLSRAADSALAIARKATEQP